MRSPARSLLLLLLPLCLLGCATANDPLKQSRKLIKEGHATLYNNGAFQVPNTHLTLIPAGPSAFELAGELFRVRAKESFFTAVKNAAESVTVVADGTRQSWSLAGEIHEGTNEATQAIRDRAHEGSKLVIKRSSALGKSIVGESWNLSKTIWNRGSDAGDAIRVGGKQVATVTREGGKEAAATLWERGGEASAAIREGGKETAAAVREGGKEAAAAVDTALVGGGQAMVTGSLATAADISSASLTRSGDALRFGKESFVRGYATIPQRLKERGSAISERVSAMNPVTIAKEDNEWRQDLSQGCVDLVSDTLGNYTRDVGASFSKAGAEIDAAKRGETGISLALLKSLRWALKGIFWDATIEPIAKVGAAALGYVTVNAVAYPTMVVVREGVATTHLALQVTWDAAGTGYDVVAPTATAAVAGVYALADVTASHAVAGGTAVAGPVAGVGTMAVGKVAGVATRAGGEVASVATRGVGEVAGATVLGGSAVTAGVTRVASEVASVTVRAGSEVTGATVQYIGVPLTAAGITLGGGTVGAAVATSGAIGGSAIYVGGETAGAGTYAFGNVIAGTTGVGGTAVATTAGSALGIYEISKAAVVPPTYALGSGVVLSYGTLTHLGAHTILAASDAAYVVLSLEGPRWVLYAVTGKLDDGSELPVGSVLDLKAMQSSGEEFSVIPVSDEEMRQVVESVYDELPVVPAQ